MYMRACIADYVTQMYQNPEITRLWSRNHLGKVIVREFHVLYHAIGNELQFSFGQ